MRHSSAVALALATFFVCVPTPAHAQGVGGLIKKKATEAAKGKDDKAQAKDAGKDAAASGSAMGDCGPLTEDAVVRLLKGLRTELAQRAEFDRKLSSAPAHEKVEACKQQGAMSSDAQAIMMRGISEDAPIDQMQKAMAQNRVDLDTYLTKKCGLDPQVLDKGVAYHDARLAGIKAAGVSEDCYGKLQEYALAFCALSPAEQKAAMESGIRVPGAGQAEWVFTAEEARAFAPHCAELVSTLHDLGYSQDPM